MYYILKSDFRIPPAENIEMDDIWTNYDSEGRRYADLEMSRYIKKKLPPVVFHITKRIKRLTDSIVNTDGFWVFNAKLRKIINQVTEDKIQYFPAVIKTKEFGEINDDYKILNILTSIDAIDHHKSVIDYYDEGFVEFIDHLELDYAKINNHSFFRLSKCPTITIVRDDIAEAIEKNNCTGLVFKKPEDICD